MATASTTAAPIYLAAVVLGMFALIFVRPLAVKFGMESKEHKRLVADADADEQERLLSAINTMDERGDTTVSKHSNKGTKTSRDFTNYVIGLVLAGTCGLFGASQYAVLTVAKQIYQKDDNCSFSKHDCPHDLSESFDNFGSWIVSFGIGALLVTLTLLALVSFQRFLVGRPPPSLHWDVLKTAGVSAGLSWSMGNFLITAAVRGSYVANHFYTMLSHATTNSSSTSIQCSCVCVCVCVCVFSLSLCLSLSLSFSLIHSLPLPHPHVTDGCCPTLYLIRSLPLPFLSLSLSPPSCDLMNVALPGRAPRQRGRHSTGTERRHHHVGASGHAVV